MRSTTIRKPHRRAAVSAAAPTQLNGTASIPGDSIAAAIMREGPLTISQAARLYPSIRQGKPTNPATVWRHITEGVKLPGGQVLKLEACRWAGKFFTSAAAIGRFLVAQQDLGATETARIRSSLPRTPGQRRRASERAAAELARRGI